MKKAIVILLVLYGWQLNAQPEPPQAYFWVAFTDKADSAYSIERPEAFLSERAIERRKRFGIPVTGEDLPVSGVYLDSITAVGGVIHNTSRWMNAATVLFYHDSTEVLESLSFVDTMMYVGKFFGGKSRSMKVRKFSDTLTTQLLPDLHYGYGTPQITTLAGDSLHRMGYQGEGIMIAVLDGGFYNVDTIPFFDSLRFHNRLIHHRDFVDGDVDVFESSSHGTQVLSLMAANKPGLLVGTAPAASYICLKTEDVRGEYLLEECNWIAALEYADSLGVDIVNSSLGYTIFNDRAMNYSYQDMNGRVALSSRAAGMAYRRGMIVVSSAGNEGNSHWKYISVPADAAEVLSVGSIDEDGKKSGFSSIGPTSDGRIKPDVAAMGAWVAVASPSSFRVMIGSGTSFSAPVMTGMVACLWQAFPEKSNREILDAIKKSAHQCEKPDNELGYGVPNFVKAFKLLQLSSP